MEINFISGRTSTTLSNWLNEITVDGLVFLLADDRMILKSQLFEANAQRAPFPVDRLVQMDWSDTDIRVESQKAQQRVDSIQARVIRELKTDSTWSVILDDDGSGEVADVVALRIDDDGLLIHLFHCKYAHGDPGSRVDDLYEVCGQAQKCVTWRRGEMIPLFRNLERRARKKHQRTGVSPFEVGDLPALYRLREHGLLVRRRLEVTIVQPGLSAKRVSAKQLELLGATEAYLRNTVNAKLHVWCNRL
jgi:hypothetical protein